MNSLQIGRLILKKPVFQGGMGIGVSLGGLAGAVAKAGGAGTISAAQIGFREPDFDEHPLQANLRAMEKELKRARAIAPDGVIGFNIMVAMRHYEAYVRCAVQLGADFIVSGAGLPVDLPGLVGDAPVCIAPVVSTQKSARVILRYWEKKHHRVPDFLVIEGPLAGGHLGFTRQQLAEYSKVAYEEEIRRILETCREYEERFQKKIPVVLAGGISTARAVRRAFELGADAVQSATRFVTTRECDAADEFKQAYIRAEQEDVILVKSPVGLPGRAIRNHFTDTVMSGQRMAPVRCRGCLKDCRPDQIPYCITEALIRSVKGDAENGLVFCGADAYLADHLESVEEVMDSLLPGSEKMW